MNISEPRIARGWEYWKTGRVSGHDGQYIVVNGDGESYHVHSFWHKDGPDCDCPDRKYRGQVCKHIWAASFMNALERAERAKRNQDWDDEQLFQYLAALGLRGIPNKGWRVPKYEAILAVIQDRLGYGPMWAQKEVER